jgi:hypothetical protein
MPFDFNPFSLDFPALTLQCLEPPPTLFASTQHPTPTSWSILPPGQSQLEALYGYFEEEFRRWKITCAAATTAVTEELTYPPSLNIKTDTKAEVRKAEKAAEEMEKDVYHHLKATYEIWNGLAQEIREQLWRLELARGLGRKQKEVDKLKEGRHLLRQENSNLKTQIEQLTRLQQPREFKIAPPSTVFMDEKLMAYLLEEGVVNRKPSVGLNLSSRHSDLNTIVSTAIDRWKDVIVSSRSATTGLQAQRPLHTMSTGERSPGISIQGGSPQNQRQPQRSLPTRQNPPQVQHPSTTVAQATNYPASLAPTTTAFAPPVAAPSTAPSVSTHQDEDEDGDEDEDEDEDGDEDMSDQDADADDDDDDAHGDIDADADMDYDSGDYSDSPLQPKPQPQLQQQQPSHLLASTPIQQMARYEMAQTQAMGGNMRAAPPDGDGAGMAGNSGLGQGHAHGRGRMPSWA